MRNREAILKRKITIKDVAAAAGVSTTTVSHSLTGKRHVKRETRERVQKAIETLNYKPNVIAQSLKQSRTNTIGVIVPDITNPFFTGLINTIENSANREGFSVILNSYNDEPELEKKCINVLLQKQVDGIILAPGSGNEDYIRNTLSEEVPTVLMDRTLEGCRSDMVELDNYNASFQAVRYLLDLGHSRIGFIGGFSGISSNREREKGYLDALAMAGQKGSDDYIQRKQARISGGYEGTRELMRRPIPPTALFLGSNTLSLGAIQAMRELSLTCPEDISIISFGDFEWSTAFEPRLTCIHTPVEEMGQRAMKSLIKRIRNPEKEPEIHKIPCTMVLRNSCKPPLD